MVKKWAMLLSKRTYKQVAYIAKIGEKSGKDNAFDGVGQGGNDDEGR